MAISKIKKCIEENKCFYLIAAAGSGKTYTLVESLKYILNQKSILLKDQSISCITYTNIAKKEILERIDFANQVEVYTIHEFFWKVIKNYQIDLKEILQTKLDTEDKKNEFKNINKIQYKEYRKYEKGIISHNDIINFTKILFDTYNNKFSKIISSKYKYIFVDEYQDTNEDILKILTTYLSQNCVIGLFGDPIQKIYSGTLYDISTNTLFTKIKKFENYRSGEKIVSLLNKLREDIVQESKTSISSNIKFYYNPQHKCLNYILKENFSEDELKDRKHLYLVHRRISKVYNYELFYNFLQAEKILDCFIDNNRNREINLINYLYFIEECCYYYKKDYAQKLLETLNYKINLNNDKIILRNFFRQLISIKDSKTIKEVLDFIKKENIIEFLDIDDSETSLYEKIKTFKYINIEEIYNIYNSFNKIIRTKHSTKGEEYDSVEIHIADKNDWNLYNFENYFLGKKDNNYERVRNLFYVACSRAKKNLIINFEISLSSEAIYNVKQLFGDINFISNIK